MQVKIKSVLTYGVCQDEIRGKPKNVPECIHAASDISEIMRILYLDSAVYEQIHSYILYTYFTFFFLSLLHSLMTRLSHPLR